MLDLELGMIDVRLIVTALLVHGRGVGNKVIGVWNCCHGQQCHISPCYHLPAIIKLGAG